MNSANGCSDARYRGVWALLFLFVFQLRLCLSVLHQRCCSAVLIGGVVEISDYNNAGKKNKKYNHTTTAAAKLSDPSPPLPRIGLNKCTFVPPDFISPLDLFGCRLRFLRQRRRHSQFTKGEAWDFIAEAPAASDFDCAFPIWSRINIKARSERTR